MKKCWLCGAKRGLRPYETSGGVEVRSICAEWLVPCHRRRNAFGRDFRRRFRRHEVVLEWQGVNAIRSHE